MPRTGRPPKPAEQKRLIGNPGKRPLTSSGNAEVVVLPPVTVEPAAPPQPSRPLGSAGSVLWERAWQYAWRWMAETDVELLLLTCEQLDERTHLRVSLIKDPANWRQRSQLRALEAAISSGLASLGFTPEARTRLALGEVKVADALARFREQARGLRGDVGS